MRCSALRYCMISLFTGAAMFAPCSFAGVNHWTTSVLPPATTLRQIITDPTDPEVAYALTAASGVFKTTNGGAYWQAASDGLPAGATITALAARPAKTLYAATGIGIYTSDDGGSQWRLLGQIGGVSLLAADPMSKTLYAGNSEGISVSNDDGKTWRQTIAAPRINSLAVAPNGTVYVANVPGLFRSTDHGQSWQDVSSAPSFTDHVWIDAAAGTIYALEYETVSVSRDGGKSWSATPPLASINAIASGGTADVFAATTQGPFEYTAGSGKWSPLGQAIQGKDVHAIAVSASTPHRLYATLDFGAVTILDDDWIPANAGLPGTAANDVAVAPTTPSTAYAAGEAGLFKTVDGGEHWVNVQTTPSSEVEVSPSDANTAYASSSIDLFQVVKTKDGGGSWTVIKPDFASVLAVAPSNPGTLYAALYGPGMFKSTDGGASWSGIMTGLPLDYFYGYGGWTADSIAVDPVNEGTVYIGKPQGIFKTANGGSVWGQVAPFKDVRALAIDAGNPAMVYAATNGVMTSMVGQTNWTSAGLIDKNVSALAASPTFPPVVVAGTEDGHVYLTSDGGAYWTELEDHGIGLPITRLSVDSGAHVIFAATSGGVYQYDLVDDSTSLDRLPDDAARVPHLIDQLVRNASNSNAGFVLPVAGKVVGIGGSLFVTEVILTNARDAKQNVVVAWLPQAYGGIARSFRTTLPASSDHGGTATFADIAERLNITGIGSLAVVAIDPNGDADASASIGGSSSIWVHDADGRAPRAQTISAVRPTAFSDHVQAAANNLEQDASFRTNVGIVNLSSEFRQFTIAIHGSKATGQLTFAVPPFSLAQVPVGGDYGTLNVTVTADQSTRWLLYASTIDNTTSDARTTLGVPTD